MSKDNLHVEDTKAKTKISKNEKIFWFSIFVLIIIFTMLSVFATLGQREQQIKKSITIESVLSDEARVNLENANEEIRTSLDIQMLHVDSEIDKEVDTLFEPIFQYQVDLFLDFHYSVKGEYTELFTMAGDYINVDDKANELIAQKLLGTNFVENFSKSLDSVDATYIDAINEHYALVDEIAFSDVDKEENSKVLARLTQDIETNMMIQSIKGGVIALHFAPKIATALGVKIATKTTAKAGGKVAAKSVVKVAGIGGGASAGASAGLICGPFAWICSPLGAVVGAGAAWIATDAVIVNADEMFNREKFKKEIVNSLEKSKKELKLKLQREYNQGMIRADKKMQEMLKDTPIVKKQIIMDKIIENLTP